MSTSESSLRIPGQSVGLLTDLYQLTMAYGYWKTGELETESARLEVGTPLPAASAISSILCSPTAFPAKTSPTCPA
jgi:hypothetical protein